MKKLMNDVKYYFPSIDILRGFAAISVLVYHVIEILNWKTFPVTGTLIWFRWGWMGVDIFFVISGFVISLAAFSQIDKHGTTGFIKSFMMRRIKRIVPLYYLTLLVFLFFISPGILLQDLFVDFFKNILSHLFFVHNLNYNYQGGIDGVNWSLATEMQFYLLIALLAPWLRVCNVFKVIIPALLISYSWRFGAFLHSDLSKPLATFHLFVLTTQLPGMLDEFLIGFLIARFIRTQKAQHFMSKEYLSTVIFLFVSIILSLLAIYIYRNYTAYWPYPYMVTFFRTLLGLSAGSIVLFLCSFKVNLIVKKLLFPFYYLGTISYGIYLWHLPVILSIKRIEWLSHKQSATLILVMTIILAALSWNFFEKQFIKK